MVCTTSSEFKQYISVVILLLMSGMNIHMARNDPSKTEKQKKDYLIFQGALIAVAIGIALHTIYECRAK